MKDVIQYDVQPDVKEDGTVEIVVSLNGEFAYAYRTTVPDDAEDALDFAYRMAAEEIGMIALGALRARRELTDYVAEVVEMLDEAKEAGRQEQRVKSPAETLKGWSNEAVNGNDNGQPPFKGCDFRDYGRGGYVSPSSFGG